MQCQRQGLDWSGFLHLSAFCEPVQVLELSGLDCLHFVSLCRFWSLGCLKPAQAQTNANKSVPLLMKNGRQIAELFHKSIVLQNFPEVSNFSMTKGGDELGLNLIREDDVLQEEVLPIRKRKNNKLKTI